MATVHSGGDGKENRNITMHISVFCGASLPHSEQITEAARQLGRAIARGGTATSKWASAACPNTAPPTKSIHTDCSEKTSHNNE